MLETGGARDAAQPLRARGARSRDVLNELFGLGPLEAFLRDPAISDILVNRHDQIYIEREGRIEESDIVFKDDKHLMQIIERIVSAVGRRIDESSPMVDARLADGSRVNAIIPPLALDGPALSIRRFRTDRLGAQDLVERELADAADAGLPARRRWPRGSTSSCRAAPAPARRRCSTSSRASFPIASGSITIEDAAELMLRQRHVVRLETRPANIEGKGAVRQRELVINALRMRPDRIVVGEVRGEEALDMLQAMNTGHDGSLTTIHANSPRDALYRLDTMVAMANLNVPDKAIRQQVASAVNLIVQISRMSDGTRKVTGVAEITGMEGDVITMQDLFVFERTGITPEGRVTGKFRATGIRPKCSDKLAAAGFPLPTTMFEHVKHGGREEKHDGLRCRNTSSSSWPLVLGIYWVLIERPEAREQGKLQQAAARGTRDQAAGAAHRLRQGGREAERGEGARRAAGTTERRRRLASAPDRPAPTADDRRQAAAASACLLSRRVAARRLAHATALARARRRRAARRACRIAVVQLKATKRLRKFEEQFPEAIDLIARALRAGHAFTTGLAIVAEEAPQPVAGEFRLLYDQQNFGMPLPRCAEGVRRAHSAARRPVLRDRRADAARERRQPGRDPRQPGAASSASASR